MQGEGGFICRGQKFGFYPKHYEKPLQALNCRTGIYTEHL